MWACKNQLLAIYLLVWCHTWLLMLLLSPNTKYPPTQAARKAWDWELFPCILSCSACSPLYVNTKYARLREWVYVAFKMALSLSFKLSERGRNVHTQRAIELESNSKVHTDQLGPVTCHFWIEKSSPGHEVLGFWLHIWERKWKYCH